MDTLLGIAVVIATLTGPIAAVFVTRYIDQSREVKRRRLEIFRMLMRTRRATLSIDHVTALNMVEIDFHGVPSVILAFRDLHQHLGVVSQLNWAETRVKLQTKLLTAMAKSLGYNFEQLEVLDGGYTPQGWVTAEQELQQARQLLIELLSGRRALPIAAGPSAPPAPFPPLPPLPPQAPLVPGEL